MKEAIKLVLVYFACQIVGAILAMIPCAIIALVLYKDFSLVQDMMLAPSMLVGFGLMTFYLFRKKYIPFDLQSWSAVSASYLSSVILLTFSVMFLIDWLMSHLTFLPNWLDASFDVLSSNWLGILSVSVLGPILEELLFRGAITKILLKKYKPAKAIILSGLIFGIFHLNPVQVVGAALVGFVFAWMYYKTKSLLPGIVMHIVNNSTSVYLATKYPDVDYLNELSGDNYTLYLGIAMALMILLVLYMEKLMAHKKRENANIIN